MNRLRQLAEFGQQYWLDDLTRTMLRSGELQRRVTEEGLAGLTSNPSTFAAAVRAGADYQADITRLAGRKPEQILESLMVEDVRAACDVFAPQYRASEGRTGYVSLEVPPQLANDAERSIEAGRVFWDAVERPNLFIKIPGTAAGVIAIEQLLVEGINVNVTLLFRIERYEAVARAYVRALERRRAQGLDVTRVRSVASLFLSRIDTRIDERLEEQARAGYDRALALKGRCAIANAKLAYQGFKSFCALPQFVALREAGARPQELLWASTGTKNPEYPDLLYVEPLIGPDTITTLPAATAAAFADHGEVAATLELEVEEAGEILRALADVGIDVSQELEALLAEGIDKFVASYEAAVKTVAGHLAGGGQPRTNTH